MKCISELFAPKTKVLKPCPFATCTVGRIPAGHPMFEGQAYLTRKHIHMDKETVEYLSKAYIFCNNKANGCRGIMQWKDLQVGVRLFFNS